MEQPGKKSKDDVVRDQLEPLADGKRPWQVTVAAILAAILSVVIVLPYLVGSTTISGTTIAQAVPMAILLLICAAGMWRAKYWAVLGFQAYLVITMIVMLMLLINAASVLSAVRLAVFIIAAGAMFWGLVKSMARIQMP